MEQPKEAGVNVKRSVVLSTEENDDANAIAKAERRSFNSVIRQALKEFLERRRAAKREAA